MNNETQTEESKRSHIGEGMALGVSLGLLFGMLLLDGNIGLGMALGLCLGLIIGSIVDANKKQQSS